MKNKVTAKDVAIKAGVSVATVSYVLNGRDDQKISLETKKKVIQIANLLNYVPSHAAKSLATGRNNAIGISYTYSEYPTKNAVTMQFVHLLSERLNRMKYDVTFIPVSKASEVVFVNRNIDAIIAVDLTHSDFRLLADNYLVPVICVDMIVNDSLFYQVYEDLPFLVEKALIELKVTEEKVYFVYDYFDNAGYEDFILNLPSNIVPIRSRELTDTMIESFKGSKVIVNGGVLALMLAYRLPMDDICVITSEADSVLVPSKVKRIINNDNKKANITINIVMNALDKNFDVTHDHKIR